MTQSLRGPAPEAYRWPPHLVVVEPILDESACALIDAFAADVELAAGGVADEAANRTVIDPGTRLVRQASVPRTPTTEPIYQQVLAAGLAINDRWFGFDLDGPEGGLLMVEYGPGDFFDWHIDVGASEPRRKLSVSILLTDPSDYGGGALNFPGTVADSVPRGHGIVFPSFLLHAVQPITRGRRRALIAWFGGAPFR